jgi:hypothetical protein
MKTITYVILALAVLLGSCAYAEGGAFIEETTIIISPLKYEMRVYDDVPNSKSTIRIEYPFFQGIDEVYMINDIVFDKLVHFVAHYYIANGFDSLLDLDYKCEVTLNNGKFISIVFWGTMHYLDHGFDKDGTHVDTININALTKREVAMRDMLEIDSAFIDMYYAKAYHPIDPETSTPDTLLAERNHYQDVDRIRRYQETGASYYWPVSTCYLKPDGIVFTVIVGQAAGEHYEAQLDYSDILPFYRLDTRVWED